MRSTVLLLILLHAAITFIRNADGARILGIFPLNGKSHFVMYREVMKSLADAGHQVDVVSHFPLDKPHANYTDIVNLAGTLPPIVNNISFSMIEHLNKIPFKVAFDSYGIRLCKLFELPELQKLIKSPPKNPPYDLFVTEYFLAGCYVAFGRHLNVPVVALSSLHTFFPANDVMGNPHNTAIVSELPNRPFHMNFWTRLTNTLFISLKKMQHEYYMHEQTDIVREHFGSEMPEVRQLEREISLMLVNSHSIFHNVRPFTPAVVEVAGIHVTDDNIPLPNDLEKWANDSKNGFIYFSFGSMAKIESLPKPTIAELYKAFADIAPIRILIKVAYPEELPPGLPENVKTLKWAPQVQILKHKNIRAFVTHGGLMGLQEAVTFGVPLIGVPLFGDQPGNIHMCVQRGIAVYLDYKDLTADKIVAAVNAVVYDPTYKNNMNKISKQFLDRPRNARDTCVFWIEYILKYGAEALQSPAVKLSWWQLALLDVYGAILASILIALYIVKFLLSMLYRQIFHSNVTVSTSKKSR